MLYVMTLKINSKTIAIENEKKQADTHSALRIGLFRNAQVLKIAFWLHI